MDRLASESEEKSESVGSPLANSQSLLGGIRRVFHFFILSESSMIQAGINLGYSQRNEHENSVNPPAENNYNSLV